MYKIKVDTELNLVTIELEGFWTESDFEKFIADQHAALSKLKCRIGKHRLLCDLNKLNVVAQDVARRVTTELNSQGPRDAEWLAISVSSALLKLQIQRLLTRSNARIFDDVVGAQEWLLSSSDERTS